MLTAGSFPAQNCPPITRRAFLQAGAALPLAATMAQTSLAAVAPKANSVLLVWLFGGPSHLDLFDPKPGAPMEYRGPFGTLSTRIPGVHFSELLPKLAARSDRFSLVRTNTNFTGSHRPAGSIGLTGSVATDGGEDAKGSPSGYPPNFGSILARHREAGDLPGFISIGRNHPGDGGGPSLGYGGGTWGSRYDPFLVSCSKNSQVSLPGLELLDGITPNRLADRWSVLNELDGIRRRVGRIARSEYKKWNDVRKKAYALLHSADTIKAFDLSGESEKTRSAFGHTSFGQSCLLGRRLVEVGVPYVQVNWSQYAEVLYTISDYGWDTHADNFELLMDFHGPRLDRALSALLDDLEQRGLLETTLVVCMGEFGRTPKINGIGSRDHWHKCYFSIWAGGGIRPGQVIGESDRRGEFPLIDPVTPAMVGTTILELAGMNAPARSELKVLEGARLIDGLL